MITEFQDSETEPSVFVLSLKAGGVGITLTKANHVFHFTAGGILQKGLLGSSLELSVFDGIIGVKS